MTYTAAVNQPRYRITKTYGNDQGLSAVFRQAGAKSHCRFLHGYALGFEIAMDCEFLDSNSWVFDFGSFKEIKAFLANTFDHKLIVGKEDYEKEKAVYNNLRLSGMVEIVVVNRVGCESFAQIVAHRIMQTILDKHPYDFTYRKLRVAYVKCFEHSGNAAYFYPREEDYDQMLFREPNATETQYALFGDAVFDSSAPTPTVIHIGDDPKLNFEAFNVKYDFSNPTITPITVDRKAE